LSIRYIGSKSRVAETIVSMIGSPNPGQRFVDGFCGTGAVSAAALDLGWRDFVVNDSLLSAGIIASARLTSERHAPFSGVGGYRAVLAHLNSVEGAPGFIASSYSPLSASSGEGERRYFTEDNASRIDSVRAEIGRLAEEGLITEVESRLLIADLLLATNAVANTAGTYGCFLREWSPVALKPLTLKPRELQAADTTVEVLIGDIADLETRETDVVYLDPPYTKRQYAAYYHVLETVAHGDSPEVGGVTGLRPWQSKASDFCYSRRAQDAVLHLLVGLDAGNVYMSYSSDGFVDLERLVESLEAKGEPAVLYPVGEIGRYRPNEIAGRQQAVAEWLLVMDRAARWAQ